MRICSKLGCGYSTLAMPFLRLMKSSTIPDCKGPGRNSATSATTSSNTSGCKRRIRSFMPRDSSWNTAVVFCALSRSKLALSSSGMRLMSTGGKPFAACLRLMVCNAQSMMVRLRKPKKSNLTSPMSSTSFLSNCDTTPSPFSSQQIAVKSVKSVGEISTPPACLPVLRDKPSSEIAKSSKDFTSSSRSDNSIKSGDTNSASFLDLSLMPNASCSVMPMVNGISLAIRSTKP